MTRRIFIFFTLFFLLFHGNAQTVQLSIQVSNPSSECDTDLKLFQVYQKNAAADSLVWSAQDSLCHITRELDFPAGKYLLKVRSLESGEGEAAFEIPPEGGEIKPDTIRLGNKASELEGVTITGVPKKFIQVDAEKTSITVEGNPILEVSSVYDAILKIPGIIPYPGGGFAMGGQMAGVYFDGIPSPLSATDLENLLKSLPATSVQKIELIYNPGASYDASFSGAIIDIISQGRVSKWISGTVTLNAGFNRNQKYAPSVLLSGKGKKYSWQVQTGCSRYGRDYASKGERYYRYFDTATVLSSDRREFSNDRNIYLRPSFTYRFNKKSFLQLNLGGTVFLNDGDGNSGSASASAVPLQSYFVREGKGKAMNAGIKYRLFLDTLMRKMEIGVNYNRYVYDNARLVEQQQEETTYSLLKSLTQSERMTARSDFEFPFAKWKFQLNTGLKWSYSGVLSEGAYRLNDSIGLGLDAEVFNFQLPFRYEEENMAAYTELKKQFGKKFSVTAGLRAEDYRLQGKVEELTLISRNYFNLFPSVHTLYRITPDIVFTASYARKINLPSYSQFDPNVSGYYDSYTQSTGNSQLKPNFVHRSNARLTIFDYMQLSVDYSLSNSINLSEITADSNSYVINQTYKTYENVQTWSCFFSLPLPFGIFKQGLKFFQQAIDVDAISFMYLYANNNKTYIPGYDYVNGNKSLWTFGTYSQVILPWKIRLNVDYNFTARGMYQLSETTRPIHDLELVLSREFKDDKWRVALTLQDVFNSNASYGQTSYNPLLITSYYKQDTRSFWIKISHSFGRYERPSIKESGIPAGNE
ncbi:MAG: TonB-dependent receptor domain-containing protein [Bacteroidota bacterium]